MTDRGQLGDIFRFWPVSGRVEATIWAKSANLVFLSQKSLKMGKSAKIPEIATFGWPDLSHTSTFRAEFYFRSVLGESFMQVYFQNAGAENHRDTEMPIRKNM